ncbi:MAG: hypothetical protein A2Z99_09125 [Treponema sp. GWB1_62_6]|nr:MAG: hypothetical protein A2Z99_09125 [Treponema sp. GWB1_62_6]OHE70176.1 MAG: hypothetical protein A2001_06835 [Treponema sp. GWC1_61_84]HCM28443.1 hypothetical protein [Treponema sp.]
MIRIARIAAGVSALTFACASAWSFEGFSDAPGSHMETMKTALVAVYRAPSSRPVLVKTMPVFGLKTYEWEAYRAADLLSDASRDIDSHFFGILYPHAQTKSFPYSRPLDAVRLRAIEEEALFDYVVHMGTWIDRVRRGFAAGDDREAGYLLGVLAHSYQDLWAHRGITNEMHKALLAHEGIDVDRDSGRVLEMRERLSAWLADLPAILGPEAGPAFLAFLRSDAEIAPFPESERKKLLGRGRDIFVHGIGFVLFTSSSVNSLRHRADIEWDVDVLDGLLRDGEALDAASRLSGPAELAAFLEARGYDFRASE